MRSSKRTGSPALRCLTWCQNFGRYWSRPSFMPQNSQPRKAWQTSTSRKLHSRLASSRRCRARPRRCNQFKHGAARSSQFYEILRGIRPVINIHQGFSGHVLNHVSQLTTRNRSITSAQCNRSSPYPNLVRSWNQGLPEKRFIARTRPMPHKPRSRTSQNGPMAKMPCGSHRIPLTRLFCLLSPGPENGAVSRNSPEAA